jgi:hypothetical protein
MAMWAFVVKLTLTACHADSVPRRRPAIRTTSGCESARLPMTKYLYSVSSDWPTGYWLLDSQVQVIDLKSRDPEQKERKSISESCINPVICWFALAKVRDQNRRPSPPCSL